jgi:hypothetical protein
MAFNLSSFQLFRFTSANERMTVFRRQQLCFLSQTTSSSTSNTVAVTHTTTGNMEVETNSSKTSGTSSRRVRHKFRNNNTIDSIPSFRDFQQTIQIRTLYRQFIRLFKNRHSGGGTGEDSSKNDLKDQVRREFRQQHTDSWSVKKALSEGKRRYKDLSAMIGMRDTTLESSSSSTMTSLAEQNITTSSHDSNNNNNEINDHSKGNKQQWPWNTPNNKIIQKPLRFPKKSE